MFQDIAVTFTKAISDGDIRELIRNDQRNNYLADFTTFQEFYQHVHGDEYHSDELVELRLLLVLKMMRVGGFLFTVICMRILQKKTVLTYCHFDQL